VLFPDLSRPCHVANAHGELASARSKEEHASTLFTSIDGGGLRGIIPAVALAKLESTTCQLARETLSFVGGTSTGAIIAAAIAAGIPAADFRMVYRGVLPPRRKPFGYRFVGVYRRACP